MEGACALPRRLGVAPGDELRHDKPFPPFAKAQVIAPPVRDLATGRGDDGMAGRDVPFAGRSEAGIDVGTALRDPAEFDRRSQRLADGAGPRLDEGVRP